jgi:adenylate cyclase
MRVAEFRDHLRHRGGMTFEDLGDQLLKNIAHPVRAFRLLIGNDPPDGGDPGF